MEIVPCIGVLRNELCSLHWIAVLSNEESSSHWRLYSAMESVLCNAVRTMEYFAGDYREILLVRMPVMEAGWRFITASVFCNARR